MSTFLKGDVRILITNDPYHKRKGLYVGNKYCVDRIATFRNDEDADAFDNLFSWFLGLGGRNRRKTEDDGK